jgi:Domain of unknown function (DUF3362)
MEMATITATCMYSTGVDSFTKQKVYVARHLRDRKLQRALLQFFKPENYFEVRKVLEEAGPTDPIGGGCDALIPTPPPMEAHCGCRIDLYNGDAPEEALRELSVDLFASANGRVVQQETTKMGEVMTMAEINERFPSEWVLLSDPQTNENSEVLSGKVIYHSKDRDEVDRKTMELPALRDIAIFYTGPFPEDMEFVV